MSLARRTRLGTALVAALALAGGLVAPLARANEGPVLLAPLDHGVVDFGDRVPYRLKGADCAGTEVHVAANEVDGPVSQAADDPLAPGECIGIVNVPAEAAVRDAGWAPGRRLDLRVVAPADDAVLRYQRVEAEHGEVVAGDGTPIVMPDPGDPRSGADDRAVEMTTGDVISIGQVDLTKIYSVSVRVCVPTPKPHVTPSLFEVRAASPEAPNGPTSPAIVGPVDVADDLNNANKSNFGWPNCWQLQPWPITNKVPGRAPELFLAMKATATPVWVSFIDFNGTGAKIPGTPGADPAGTEDMTADGTYEGWTLSNCVNDGPDGVHGVHTDDPRNLAPLATFGFVGEAGCSMTYNTPITRSMIRFDYRMQDFADNGAIYVGGREIQMREAGEWMTGGVLGETLPAAVTRWAAQAEPTGYPAQRIKSNTYPDWSQIEIVQIGSRYIVRINGRTVTDCTDCPPASQTYTFRVASQPNFSYQYGVGWRMDTGPTNPQFDNPSNWGNVYFRNFRRYECGSDTDPVCVGGPSVDGRPIV